MIKLDIINEVVNRTGITKTQSGSCSVRQSSRRLMSDLEEYEEDAG